MASPSVLSYSYGKLTQGSGGSSLSTTLTVNFRDADASDQLSYTIIPRLNDLGGTINVVNQNSAANAGTVSFLYTVSESNIKSLAAGAVRYQAFTVQATDLAGNVAKQDVVVTITGTNDAPVVQYRPDLSFTEQNSDLNYTNPLNLLDGASDPDRGDVVSVKPGSLKVSVNNSAALDFATAKTDSKSIASALSFDGTNVAVDLKTNDAIKSLAAGSTSSILLSYLVADNNGGTVQQSQRITISGVNDAPTVASSALVGSVAKNDQMFPIKSFNLLQGATDIDGDKLYIQDLKFTVDGVDVGGATPQGVSLVGNNLQVDSKSSAFSDLFSTPTSSLNRVIVANYTINDGHGGTIAQSYNITVTGSGSKLNHVPQVQYLQEVKLTEGDDKATINLLQGATDPDVGDSVTIKDGSLKISIDNGTATTYSSTAQPYLKLNTNGTIEVDTKNGFFDTLAEGNTRSILLSYLVADNNGGTVQQSQRITVSGVNDAPTVASSALVGSVAKNDQMFPIKSFNLLQGATDIDGDKLYIQDLKFTVDGVDVGGATPQGVSLVGNNLQVDSKSSAFSDLFSTPTSSLNRVIVANYTINDGHGGTIAQSYNITVTGSGSKLNHAPQVQYLQDKQLTEGDLPSTIDLLNQASDVDGDSLAVTGLMVSIDNAAPVAYNASSIASALSLAGGKLTIDTQNSVFDKLAMGNSSSILLKYMVSDGNLSTAQTQRITIYGVNDAPAFVDPTFQLKGSLIQSKTGPVQTFDLLTNTFDADHDKLYIQDLSFTVDGKDVGGATPQGVSLAGTTLKVDPKSSAFSGLYTFDSREIVANYTISDGHGGSIALSYTITVAGTGKAPTATAIGAKTGEIYINGSAAVGETVSANTTSFTGAAPTDFTYQWFLDAAAINGAKDSTYQIQTLDIGHELYVNVTYAGKGYDSVHLPVWG